jgi:DNA invertase Pin-like site-specific DNA recombinase
MCHYWRQERGVQLIITDMGVDPITENGISKLFFTMLAAVAEFERWRIKERANDGRAGKRKKGGHIGGDAPYGWRVEGAGKAAALIKIESEQSTIRIVKGFKAQGLSLRKLSDELAKSGNEPARYCRLPAVLRGTIGARARTADWEGLLHRGHWSELAAKRHE